MKPFSRTLVVLAALTTLTLSGCASLDRQLRSAAASEGRATAELYLTELPADCRTEEPHAPLIAGQEIRSVLKRERLALDRANNRIVRCSDFYDTMKSLVEDRSASD